IREIDRFFRRYDNVIVVTSSDQNDERAFIANQSPQHVTTAAPGEHVTTTKLGNAYGPVSSTAAAAAHVAAAYGLVVARRGAIPYSQVIDGLVSDKGGDLVPALSLVSLGRNRLNISKLLSIL